MPWCPKCKTEYQKGTTHCADCNEKLVRKIRDYEILMKPNFFGNPELWAKSTLPDSYSGDDLVMIFEIKPVKRAGWLVRERMWLHDILDDNNIPYKIDIIGYRRRRKYVPQMTKRKFFEKQCIYVQKEHEKKTRRFIKEFLNPKNTVLDDTVDENLTIKDGIPQVKCSACGKEVDFDYMKCPFCKEPLH